VHHHIWLPSMFRCSVLIDLVLITILWGKYCYLHFTKDQNCKGEINLPKVIWLVILHNSKQSFF
jgi:hypothetical protein